jgi:2-dehydro-3-deoxyphosphogluconate aldolase/(4S)-4-hydroxy-2-oxoglutarate aldolase
MTVADTSIESRLRTIGLIPILRRMPEDQLLALAEAIIAGGAEAIEVTLDSPGAVDAIRTLHQRYGKSALIGAGTVMTPERLEEAIEAGAQFLLSPHLDLSLVTRAQELGHTFMPGVLTPTEIVQAERVGVTLMKLFPAGPLGPSYLKDLLGPFRGRAFFPTGGITPDNAADFIRAGAAGVGMGSALFPADDVARQDWQAITERVQSVIQRIAEAREAMADRRTF